MAKRLIAFQAMFGTTAPDEGYVVGIKVKELDDEAFMSKLQQWLRRSVVTRFDPGKPILIDLEIR